MLEWLLDLSNPYFIYMLLFGALMGGAIGLPIPEDLPLIAAGVLAEQGNITAPMALLICYFGVVTGDLIVYFIGRKLGPSIFDHRWFKKRFPKKKIIKLRKGLERRGLFMIFVARHLFYLRTATFLTCGAVRMNFVRFVIADACAALVSVPLMIWIGYLCSEHYDRALHYVDEAKLFGVLEIFRRQLLALY